MKRAAGWLVLVPVRAYQIAISPLIGPRCRYLPTCSAYLIEAIETRGVLSGTVLGMKRVLRCHPWGGHGYDPVPAKGPSESEELVPGQQFRHHEKVPNQ
ncbi:MAG: membrane protein insertion efficiency factor YidD [Gammaproteobacteria bacterium]